MVIKCGVGIEDRPPAALPAAGVERTFAGVRGAEPRFYDFVSCSAEIGVGNFMACNVSNEGVEEKPPNIVTCSADQVGRPPAASLAAGLRHMRAVRGLAAELNGSEVP